MCRRVSALANSVPTGSAPRVAPRIPLTSLVRGFLGLFAHFRPGKEENIPAQCYRTIDDFSEQTKRQSIIRRIPSASTLECSFSRSGRNDARSTNDDDALEGLVGGSRYRSRSSLLEEPESRPERTPSSAREGGRVRATAALHAPGGPDD